MTGFVVKLTSPGLDLDALKARLPAGAVVEEYDPSQALEDQVASASVFLTRSIPVTASVIDAAPGLKLIQRPGAHVEAVDIEYASSRGIPVCNVITTHGAHAVAEHALFLILAVAKGYPECARNVARRVLGSPLTYRLAGKTLGLVGVGRTGEDLIGMCHAIGMRVIAVKRTAGPEEQERLGLDWLGPMEEVDSLLAESDIVSLHLPLKPDTERYFDRERIAAMKDDAMLVNIARADIVDYEAVLEAMRDGKLAGLGLDVFWDEPADPLDPLLQFPNVVLTPHMAGAIREGRELLVEAVRANVERVMNGQTPESIVNSTLLEVGPPR